MEKMKINSQQKKKILYIFIGIFLLSLVVSALAKVNILTVLRGLIIIPLMTLGPGWIWTQNILSFKKDLLLRISYSILISMFLTVVAAYILRTFFFENMGNMFIIMAVGIPVLIGLFFNFIIFIISKLKHEKN